MCALVTGVQTFALPISGHPQTDRTATNQNKTWSRIMIDAVSADAQLQTILIVDDNPVNLSVVVDHLEEHGFQVAVAQGGEEALRRAELIEPDLILLDVMMPGIDGFETCRRLKANETTQIGRASCRERMCQYV